MSTVAQTTQPLFNLPIRWALRVLSWLAFGVVAFLAGHLILYGSAPGCVVGSNNGCDAVLQSGWSKWLSIPVAFAGLACYSTLAGLSVLLGIQSSASRWITTAFVMLAILAAGASLWFIAIQVFAIGEFCPYCIAADICGIAIGAITAWAAFNWWSGTRHLRPAGSPADSLTALRSAMPKSPRLAPVAGTRPVPMASVGIAPVAGARAVPLVGNVARPALVRRNVASPSLRIAFGGAIALLLVLIGGQIAFPGKSYVDQKLTLNKSFDMSVENGNGNGSDTQPSGVGETRVAMRIPAEQDGDAIREDNAADDASNESKSAAESADDDSAAADQKDEPSAAPGNGKNGASDAPPKSSPTAEPKRERKLKFLGGKLTLDVYKHPLIGSPEAPHIVVEMVSYDCSHCRKTHRVMKQALSRYGDQVALIVLIIPLEKGCNRLVTDPAASNAGACTTARMALGVANLKPELFARFHDYLMSGNKDKPPALTGVIAKAYNTVDRTKLGELRESNELEKQIAGNVNLYELLRNQNAAKKEFGLPIQILGDHVMSGTVEKAGDVFKAWEEHLGVKPR